MTRLRTLFLTAAVLALGVLPARAIVYLTSHTFTADNLPNIRTEEWLEEPYRLRAKIAGSYHATQLWNNHDSPLESVPGPGTYQIELYWVRYAEDWATLLEIGPFHTTTITILAANQPPQTHAVSGTTAAPGQATTLTGRATDPNGNLQGLHFYTNNPTWSGYVYAGSAYVALTGDATRSVAWAVPTAGPAGQYQAHLRASDTYGTWDWNGGAVSYFQVGYNQPTVSSQNATVPLGGAFSPALFGGAGSGPWQWVIAGRTNWGGSQPGTLLPPANTASPTWIADAAGTYYFYVIHQGDATYLPSGIAGPYVLTVQGSPPAIVSSPPSLVVVAGQPATFTVVASGGAPLSYQWRKDGIPLAGATAASLALPAAQPTDGGGYSVVVANSVGSASSSVATLTVTLAPPVITLQPASRSAAPGQSLSFTVGATGSAPLSYQWRKNGLVIAGATQSTYALASAQAADAANAPGYTVSVTNSVGSVTSNPASLTLTTTPPIRLALQYWQPGDWPDRYTGGGEYRGEWVWVEGHEEEVGHWEDWDGDGWDDTWIVDGYQWVDGHEEWQSVWVDEVLADGLYGSRWDTTVGTFGQPILTDSGAFTLAATQRGHLLHSYPTGFSHAVFRVWAHAPAGNCSQFTYVVYAPNGAATGYNGYITPGGSVEIWLPAWIWGPGSYRVDLTYSGATATTPATGTVSYLVGIGITLPPLIATHPAPATQSVNAGATVAYSVSAPGATTYQWQKDGAAIPGATGTSLALPNVSASAAGSYRVLASNTAGTTASLPAALQVVDSPWADSDGDGLPNGIEQLLATHPAIPATPDATNATLQLKIHLP